MGALFVNAQLRKKNSQHRLTCQLLLFTLIPVVVQAFICPAVPSSSSSSLRIKLHGDLSQASSSCHTAAVVQTHSFGHSVSAAVGRVSSKSFKKRNNKRSRMALEASSLLPPDVLNNMAATFDTQEIGQNGEKSGETESTSGETYDDSSSNSVKRVTDLPASLATQSSPSSPENQELSAEDLPPRFLKSLQSRKAEERVVNRFVNTGLVMAVIFLALSKVLGNALVDSRGWTSAEIALRLPIQNWNAYIDTLQKTPITVKAITSCSVYAIGDVVAQITALSADGDGPEIEIADVARKRVLISAAAGLIGHGPLSHFWYQISETFFDMTGWNSQWWVFLPKVAVDQLVWGPIWNGTYILLLGLMNREAISQVIKDVKKTSIPLLLSGLKLWPLAHCVTYGLIPVENRLLWVDMVEILWVTILSSQAASQHGDGHGHGHGSGGSGTAACNTDGSGGNNDDDDSNEGGGGGGGGSDGGMAALASVAAAAASTAAHFQ